MKKFILLGTLFFICFTAQAQFTFQHGAGVGYFYTSSIGGYAIIYAPRLNVAEISDEFSISVNAKPGASFDFSANSRTGGSGAFGFDLPVFAAVNFGFGATFDSDASFGGYLGGGYSVSSFAISDDISSGSSAGGGLMVVAGTRFFFKGQPAGVNASFSFGKGEKQNVLGIRFMYYFGDY